MIDTLAEYAPNLRDIVLHRQVVTPLDLEREWSLTQGNIFQGELTPDQLFFMRPLPGWAQYPNADQGPVSLRRRDASRWRHHGRARSQRGSDDTRGIVKPDRVWFCLQPSRTRPGLVSRFTIHD